MADEPVGETETDEPEPDEKPDEAGDNDAKLTQAEFDAALQKRLGQAKKAWEKDAADTAAEMLGRYVSMCVSSAPLKAHVARRSSGRAILIPTQCAGHNDGAKQ